MDRRTQRLFLLCLFFGVACLLYQSAHYAPLPLRKGSAGSKVNVGSQLDVKGLVPANATLGVSGPVFCTL